LAFGSKQKKLVTWQQKRIFSTFYKKQHFLQFSIPLSEALGGSLILCKRTTSASEADPMYLIILCLEITPSASGRRPLIHTLYASLTKNSDRIEKAEGTVL